MSSPAKKEVKHVFHSTQITLQPMSSGYTQVGVIHLTDSAGVNVIRGTFTGVANFVGYKGFDNSIYDYLRNNALKALADKLTPEQKVFNLRMDFETSANSTTIMVHLYGDLCEPSGGTSSARFNGGRRTQRRRK